MEKNGESISAFLRLMDGQDVAIQVFIDTEQMLPIEFDCLTMFLNRINDHDNYTMNFDAVGNKENNKYNITLKPVKK